MIIERELIAESTLEDFADHHGLVMRIYERPSEYAARTRARYCASFKRCEVKGNGVLIGIGGNGNTEQEAITDYAEQISEKTLVIDAYSEDRREIKAPRFIQKGRASD